MLFGPCGMSCLLCRDLLDGLCEGCVRGDRATSADVARHGCRVLGCASARSVAYCARDCRDFPCDQFGAGFPHCWSNLRGRPAKVPAKADGGDVRQQPRLQLFMLGRFRAVRSGRRVRGAEWGQDHGPRRKVKLLLAYLVHRGPRGARRDTLIDLAWPDETDLRKAVPRFHLALNCLRRCLEPDRSPGAPSRYIRFEGSRYRFEGGDDSSTDAAEFKDHCRRAAELARAGYRDRAAAEWSLAVDAYGGDYLAGFDAGPQGHPMHRWFQSRRRHLRRLYVTALLELASHHAQGRRHPAAAKLVMRALEVDPTSEAGHRLAMRCLADTGQLEAALRQYSQCVAALEALAATPAMETRRLYRDILASMGPYRAEG